MEKRDLETRNILRIIRKESVRTKRHCFLRRSDNRAPFLHKRNVRRYNPRKIMIVHVDALFGTRQVT